MTDRVHTCHAECPCRHGGEPSPDFLPVEGSLLPGLLARASVDHPNYARESWDYYSDALAAELCACGVISRGLVDGVCANCRALGEERLK